MKLIICWKYDSEGEVEMWCYFGDKEFPWKSDSADLNQFEDQQYRCAG